MAVYPICSQCSQRREKCADLSGHKRHVKWTANVNFGDNHRLQRTFLTKENADVQERQWITDHERGILLPQNKTVSRDFESVADEWERIVAIGQNRILNYQRSDISRVRMFKKFFGRELLSAIKYEHGETWMNERITQGKAINTINRDMKPLKWIMDYAVEKGYLAINPFTKLKELKGANIRIRWMNQAEVDLLISTAESIGDFELRDIILVGVHTGFRKGNLERLTARDIGETRITATKTKSGHPYDVPLAPALFPLLSRVLKANPIGPILGTAKLDSRFRKVAKLAGLYTNKHNPENVTIHTLRHTFAALYLKRRGPNGEKGDLTKLSKLLGHASTAITEKVYLHLCPNEMDSEAYLLGEIPYSRVLKAI